MTEDTLGMRVSAFAATDVGRVREGNEDSLYLGRTVFAVADGMGGHLAGEIASETALEPIQALDGRAWANANEAEGALAEAVMGANALVMAKADAEPSYRGMGTTLTAVLVREGRLHVAHIGDSRAYLLRGRREMNQLTTDHTLVEELIRDGRITRAEAATHPQRSVVTRAIGVDREIQVDSLPPIELQPGDQVLLCSDGLTGPVSDRFIAETLASVEQGDDACQALIAAANEAGGPDNITVVLLRAEGDPAAAEQERLPGTRAVTLNPDSTAELQPLTDVPDDGEPPPAADTAVPIRTREETGGDWADSMRRFGAPQGVEGRPDHTGFSRPRRGRALAFIVAALILLGLLGGGAWLLVSRAYFVGDHEGTVAIFRGLPQSVAGVTLQWVEEESDIETEALPRRLRERVEQGVTVGSLSEGRRLIDTYRDDVRTPAPGAVATPPSGEEPAGGSGEPTPTPAPTP